MCCFPFLVDSSVGSAAVNPQMNTDKTLAIPGEDDVEMKRTFKEEKGDKVTG